MLIKEALSILQSANTKIAELGVDVIDQFDDNSPEYPETDETLNQMVQLFDLCLKFIILNEDGDEILGTNGDNDDDVNSLLIQLQELIGIGNAVVPSPIVRINVNESGNGSLPGGASEGDLLYFHNGSWVSLAKGSDGDSLVSTATSIQWQNTVGNGIPGGGSTAQVLRKNSNTSYDVAWSSLIPSDIAGVTADVAEINKLDGANWSTAESNTLVGINTGVSIQSQIDGKIGTGLSNGRFLVGNGSDIAVAVSPSGDVTFNNAGVFAIAAGVILDADINASAGITRSKIAVGTADRILINNGTGELTDAAAITANRILISNSSGIPIHSNIPSSNLDYLDATSSIQDQLDSKLTVSLTSPAQGDIIFYNGTNWVNLAVGTNGQLLKSNGNEPEWVTDPPTGLPSGGTTAQYLRKIDGTDYNAEWHTFVLTDVTDVVATFTELNILSGATFTTDEANLLTGLTGASLQTQLAGKLTNALSYNAIFVGNASGVAAQLAPGTNGQVLTIVGSSPQWTTPASPGTFSGPVSSTDNAIVRFNGTGGDSGQNSTVIVDDSGNMLFPTGAAIRTATSAGNTLLLQAYDVDGTSYVTFITLTANNTPTMDINTAATIGSAYIYRVGGTDVSLLDGGTGASLTDPGADRIMFWDDSTGQVTWLEVGSNLSITGTVLNASGSGGISGPGSTTDNAIVAWDGTGGTTVKNSGILVSSNDLVFPTGKGIKTSTSAGNTMLIQAYDVDGTSYVTFGTLTANNTPTFDLADSVTKSGQYIYRASGTDVALSDGGTGASLSAPVSDSILFYDVSATTTDFLTPGSTLTISTTTIDVADNGITDAKLRQSAALSIVGRASNSLGNVADISTSSSGDVLRRNGTTLGFGSIDLSLAATVGSSVLGIANGGTGHGNGVWALTGTSTLTGVATITSNANSQHIFNGTWTASANNQYHLSFQPTITGRSGQTGDVVGSVVINPSLTAGTGSNTAVLVGLLIQPTFNDNLASGVIHSYIRCFDGTNVRFQVTDTNVSMAGSTTLNITTGVAGPQLSAASASLQLNATSASGNVLMQIAGNSWFGVQASNSIGATVFQVPTTVTNTATQQSSRNFNWAVNEWTGSAAQVNYWTARATQSTTTNQLSYWDLCFGTTGSAPSLTNLYLRVRNTDGAILIGATTNNTFTPNVTLDLIGGVAIRQNTKSQITSNQNDYAIGSQSVFRMSSDASRNVTGLTGGVDGKFVIIFNVGSNNIVFTNEDASSTAANRFTSSTGGNITVLPGGSIIWVYDSTSSRWRDLSAR